MRRGPLNFPLKRLVETRLSGGMTPIASVLLPHPAALPIRLVADRRAERLIAQAPRRRA
jgi:hypothetical protein